ncbi:conserved hypothetical protein, partial [Ricinus communis]
MVAVRHQPDDAAGFRDAVAYRQYGPAAHGLQQARARGRRGQVQDVQALRQRARVDAPDVQRAAVHETAVREPPGFDGQRVVPGDADQQRGVRTRERGVRPVDERGHTVQVGRLELALRRGKGACAGLGGTREDQQAQRRLADRTRGCKGQDHHGNAGPGWSCAKRSSGMRGPGSVNEQHCGAARKASSIAARPE